MDASNPTQGFRLDPSLFNRQLYISLLKFWVPGYPTPTSDLDPEVVRRWFERSDAVDAKARELAKPALDSIDPGHLQLPPFKSLEDDKQNYTTIAAPFLGEFKGSGDAGDEESRREREEAALALCILLDQMPRNVFREDEGKAIVFTHYDRIARAVSHETRTCDEREWRIHQDGKLESKGFDDCPRFYDAFPWRLWFYLPLEHTELLSDHDVFEDIIRGMAKRAEETGNSKGKFFCENGLAAEAKHRKPLELFGRYPWRNQCLGRKTTPEEQKYMDEFGGFGM